MPKWNEWIVAAMWTGVACGVLWNVVAWAVSAVMCLTK